MPALSRSKALRPAFSYVGVGLGAGVAILLFGTLAPMSAVSSIGNVQYDLLYRSVREEPPLAPELVFVDVSDRTVDPPPEGAGYGFPLPREKYAELVRGLAKAKTRAVVFDSVFPEEKPGDASLAEAFASMPTVLAIGAAVPSDRRNVVPPDELRKQRFTVGVLQPVAGLASLQYTLQSRLEFLRAARAGGHVAALNDADGIARSTLPIAIVDGKMVPSLGLATALATLGVNLADEVVEVDRDAHELVLTAPSLKAPLRIPVDSAGRMLLNYRSDWSDESSVHALDKRELHVLLESMEAPDNFEAIAPDLEGATMVVGWSATAASDYVAVPWSEGIVPGVLVQIAAANTILTGSFLRTAPGWLWKLLTILAPLSVGLAWWKLRAARAGLVTLAVVLALPLISVAAFALADTFLPIAGAASAALLTGAALAIASLSREQARAVRIAGVLSRFVSPALLRELEDSAARDRLPPAKRAECTVLFIDVAGFTPFTEGQEPEALSAFLDGFYELAMEELEKQGGTLEKFMGDGILAYFGAPDPQTDKELRAVTAAMNIRERFSKYDGQRVARGGLPLAIRCGITTDWVAVGYFGGGNRGTYGVIGRSVNLASRIQGHAEPGGILVDRTTSARLGGQVVFRPLPPIELKGITKPVEIYAVAGTAAVGSVG